MTAWASTGLPGLDAILNDIRKGDNIVWQVDQIEDYQRFVNPYIKKAKQDGRKIAYMRFANHSPLVEPDNNVSIYELDANSGFETFSTQVHSIIAKEGKEVYYVFDCLSHLLSAWATDLMIGNFFMITCPYLYELDTIAYFALLRNKHSFKTIARIRETTQLLLDLYNFEKNFYIHPLKVWRRYSPTMFLPHIQQQEKFIPLTSSVEATQLISYISKQGLEPAQRTLDYWDRLFIETDELSTATSASIEEKQQTIDRLCRVMIGRDERILNLAKQNFSLRDLLNIKNRLIGTGFIGGKAVGMLLANSIISQDDNLKKCLEPHDSFYVGSDVFYTYIVENGWWKLRMEQKTKHGYFKVAAELREKLLKGRFPDQIREQFQEMIEYFGQSPIIVRSSSLLEDAYGNAFAGKYESLFCVNQGTPEQRYAQFEDAVRRVYASTMNEAALTYRLQRNLDQRDEQMALLVQRVSGSYRNGYFFPDLAGVGFSHNNFVWNPEIDPKAGMIRLVIGLGTRAVNRVEDDYPRVIALGAPLLRPISGIDGVRKYSQHLVDVLDIENNTINTVHADVILNEKLGTRMELVASRDWQMTKRAKQLGRNIEYWLITFEKLLSETNFVEIIQDILKSLETHYQYPVDVEFTVNFAQNDKPVINLLQCRPLQVQGHQGKQEIPEQVDKEKVLLQCKGYFMGGGISSSLRKIIFVEPQAYVALPLSGKYDIARLIGRLNRQISDRQTEPTILLGPGRWGTSTPSLGIPVGFHEINNMTVLVEIAYEGGNLMPELSFGTHFFLDLVEGDIFYVALFPDKENVMFNRHHLDKMPNLLRDLVPKSEKYADVVKVYEVPQGQLQIIADMMSQKLICMFK